MVREFLGNRKVSIPGLATRLIKTDVIAGNETLCDCRRSDISSLRHRMTKDISKLVVQHDLYFQSSRSTCDA